MKDTENLFCNKAHKWKLGECLHCKILNLKNVLKETVEALKFYGDRDLLATQQDGSVLLINDDHADEEFGEFARKTLSKINKLLEE